MRLFNYVTGDILELPAPDGLGQSELRLNGQVIDIFLFGDDDVVTTGDGRMFAAGGQELTDYVMSLADTKQTKRTGDMRSQTVYMQALGMLIESNKAGMSPMQFFRAMWPEGARRVGFRYTEPQRPDTGQLASANWLLERVNRAHAGAVVMKLGRWYATPEGRRVYAERSVVSQ